MNLVTTIALTLCIFYTNAFVYNGLLNTNRLFLKELSNIHELRFCSIESTTRWIEQPLDHFDENEKRTWKMRYFERLNFWKADGPIYLFINGESEGDDIFIRAGILYELAKDTNGAMYASEHRYYGKSQPFPDLTTENLKFLTARQALADLAELLEEIKMQPQYDNSKVVVVGGSYAGNLAVWLKLLYPDLVDAAIASSAPVLAKKDFYENLESVSDDFEQYGTGGCHQTIRNIFSRYDDLFKTSEGIKQLKEEEQICDGINMSIPENKQVFFLNKVEQFKDVAQYGNPETKNIFCDDIQNISRVATSKDNCRIWSEKRSCFNYTFDSLIESIKELDNLIAWMYQTCTEFGYFTSSSSKHHPFTNNIPIDLHYSLCKEMYGPEFDEKRVGKGVKDSNNLFGGLKPNVTQVVFVNGGLDPWAKLGILEDLSDDAPSIMIARSSHARKICSLIKQMILMS